MASLSNINGKFVVEQTTGNVGIGTTDPDYLLHVNSSDVTNGTRLIIENTNGSGKKYGLIADNTGVFAVRDVTAGADRFSISNLGNATFTGALAAGATTISSTTNLLLTLNPTTGNYGGILFQYSGATKGLSYYNSGMMIYGGEAGVPIRLQAGGQYCFHADATNQNVHIGSTSDTSYKLAVNGTFNTSGNATFGGLINAPYIELSDYLQFKADDAEIYWSNAANTDYWRWKRDASNNFILDHYNGSSTTAALTLDSGGNSTFSQIIRAEGDTSYYTSGVGVELAYNSTNNRGQIGVYDRGNSVYKQVYFYGSDYLFDVSGTEKMRITSSGGISFGSTGTAYGTSGQVLTSNGNATPTWQAAGGSSPWTTSGNNIYYTTGNVSIGTSSTSFSSSYDNLIVGTGIGDNGIGIYSSSTGNSTLAFLPTTGGQSDFEIRVEHDYPFGNMEVYFQHGSDYYLRMFERNNGQDPMIKVGHNNISSFNRGADATMQFRPEQSNWFPAIAINAEDNQGNGRGFIEMISNRSSTFQADYFLKFFNVFSNEIGSIRVNNNNNNVAYNTSSDYRLKEDLKEFKALDTVCKIKVYNYTWKDDPSDFRDQGILAHELDELIPQAVSGEKDALDKDDNILPQSVDYSKIVPHLVQSIQELKAEIEILKNK